MEVTKCEGEAYVNNRRGKLIVFYEWTIDMKWVATLSKSDIFLQGTIEIDNFSEENDMEDVAINVNLTTDGPEVKVMKNLISEEGDKIIRKLLTQYVNLLRTEFSKEVILPTKEIQLNEEAKKCLNTIKNVKMYDDTCRKSSENFTGETNELQTTETFKCTAQEFYLAMTVQELIQAFTKNTCVVDSEEGGKFELFGGNVQGYFTKLVPYETIEQKWRFKTWPAGHFSEVHIDIIEKLDCTEIRFSQTGIPKDQLDNTRKGWKKFYWQSMKGILGFGALL
ncbi:activator of 90 kDa heat shock protein ATPase homolog 1 [Caerostris extrusa]|uniref:Activator of 90 kDa heat shock protein ATPase homolog 1 n=1 Tax=Caerostris extrusa TaxID=172846 RepID=A0AAV4QRE3_CAEEX|nr:activator of 90 kDa heat shock protein ATPase homolog 1 [Caerostris extrusa]